MNPIPNKLLTEARAKVCWGIPDDRVVEYLLQNQVPRNEAEYLLAELKVDRHREIRQDAFKKILAGILMMLVPIVFGVICLALGRLFTKPFIGTVALGVYGITKLVTGLMHRHNPETYQGNLGDL